MQKQLTASFPELFPQKSFIEDIWHDSKYDYDPLSL